MIGEPFTLFGHTIRVSLSAGSSIYPEHGSTLHELKVKADMAMYHVKQAGRNGWAIYHPEMEAIADTPPTFLQELSQALERNQFELWYQPKYTAGDHSLTGFEALLRWHHPERGMLLPAEFLSALEDTGLIIPVGKWVIQQACLQLHQWKLQEIQNGRSPLTSHPPSLNSMILLMLFVTPWRSINCHLLASRWNSLKAPPLKI